MAAPYQYHQYASPQHYQQGQQYQQQQQQPQQQAYGNGLGGYQQYPSQQYPQQQYSPQQYSPQQYSPQESALHQYSPQQYQHTQQQYSQSQSASQQYATSGYPTQQYHPPHQSGYQQAQNPYGQAAAQTPSQSCFNCGTPGHFAQNCPEPKRQVPAGALNPEQHRRQGIAPPKRGGQIVTKFSTQGSPAHGSPGPYTPAYSAGGYPQHPQTQAQVYTPAYTPTTPQTVPSPASNWSPQQQYVQQYQQYQQPQSGGYYPPSSHQSWQTPATPAPITPFATPQTSQPPSHSQYGVSLPTPQSHYGPIQATTSQDMGQTQTPSQQSGQSLERALNHIEALQRRQADDNTLATANSAPSPPALCEISTEGEEAEEDDLSLLDVPDFPPSTAQYGESVVPLVGMPIPANFIVADALFPMDPPPPEAEGHCQSKYARTFQAETLSLNIRESTYWKDHKEDVIFITVALEAKFISVDECRSRIRDRQRPPEEISRESRSESRSMGPPRKEAVKSLDQLQKALEQAKADIASREKRLKEKKGLQSPAQARSSSQDGDSLIKTEPVSPPQSANIENGSGYHDDSEDLLASLGVTGTAKPVGPPSRLVSHKSTANDEAKPYSRSVSRAENTDQYDNTTSSTYQQPSPSMNTHPEYPQNPQHHVLPPPPPPAFDQIPHGKRSYPDGGYTSPRTSTVNPFGHRPSSTENGYGNYQYQPENPSLYSSQNRSESSANRKRAFDERSSSEESEEEARRQEDDITPKMKRRQPKVAEAYSRRW